jgi:hypothetical protein
VAISPPFTATRHPFLFVAELTFVVLAHSLVPLNKDPEFKVDVPVWATTVNAALVSAKGDIRKLFAFSEHWP